MKNRLLAAALVVSAASFGGCGLLIDSDRIVIAELDGEPIRRGDLNRILREMDDEERPIIRNRGDLLRTLTRYIDDRIKMELGQRLREEGAFEIPREQAEQVYFQRNPEHRNIRNASAQALDMSQAELEAMIQQIEYEIDDVETEMYAESALMYVGQQRLQDGTLTITPEDFEREYELRKEHIKSFETVDFTAIQFLASMPDAHEQAAKVVERLLAGESFEAIFEEFRAKGDQHVLVSRMENNPAVGKFAPFWMTVSGVESGTVVQQPVYLPSYDVEMQRADGQRAVRSFPAAYLVLRVDENIPAKTLGLEQARPSLVPGILMVKTMKMLREEHGVEIYEENLPDPAGYGNQFSDIGPA